VRQVDDRVRSRAFATAAVSPLEWSVAGRLESINASRGGVPKHSMFEALITDQGLDGDRQRDLRFHGGPDRAIVLFSLDVIRALQREGHTITAGATGENLTVSGLDWPSLTPRSELVIGEVRLAITKYTSPCEKIAFSFVDGDYTRISQKLHPGWSRLSARVLHGGLVAIGDTVEIARA
jgi:MOSC domain-containing protein YiiM